MTFVRDFIPELPVEIRISITDFLDLSDLIVIRSVSKRWYHSWAHTSICNKLMKQHFRSAFENTYQLLPDHLKPPTLMAACDRLHAMRQGKYHSMKIVSYHRDIFDSDEPSPILDRRYNDGRVAWAIEERIKVTTLATGETRTYMSPDRNKMEVWAISEKLAVAVSGDKTKLHAWLLDDDDADVYTVRLPSMSTDNFTTFGSQVGIITTSNEVMIWQVSRDMNQLKITDPLTDHKGYRELAVMFHPDSLDTVYVILLACKKVDEGSQVTGNVQWIVQKYVRGKLVNTYQMELPLEGLDYSSGDEPSDTFWLSPREIDDNGNFSLGPVPVDFASSFLDLGCHHHWDRWYRRRGHRHLAMHVTFNVYEECLSTKYYHLPGGHKDDDYINFVIPQEGDRPLKENAHLWSGQIFLPILKLVDPVAVRDPMYKLPVKKALLMAIKSCDQISGPPEDVKYVGGYGLDQTTWVYPGRFATRDLGLIYCWVGDLHLAQQEGARNEHYTDREVIGDGKLVVLFGEYDYVVWCYDKHMLLPEQE